MTANTLLFRQIHPSFVQNGRVTSQPFRPTPKDQSMLSVYDGDLISPEKSWVHFTTKLMRQSEGTMAVSVAECATEHLNVLADPDTFLEHALIDFTGLTDKQCHTKSKKLQAKATERGWCYPVVAG